MAEEGGKKAVLAEQGFMMFERWGEKKAGREDICVQMVFLDVHEGARLCHGLF